MKYLGKYKSKDGNSYEHLFELSEREIDIKIKKGSFLSRGEDPDLCGGVIAHTCNKSSSTHIYIYKNSIDTFFDMTDNHKELLEKAKIIRELGDKIL